MRHRPVQCQKIVDDLVHLVLRKRGIWHAERDHGVSMGRLKMIAQLGRGDTGPVRDRLEGRTADMIGWVLLSRLDQVATYAHRLGQIMSHSG